MIPLAECKHGGLYRIISRNLSFGVFDKPNNGFIGIREKFGYYFLFTEYHYDTGAPYGTVSPQEYLEEYPGEVSESIEKILTEADLKQYPTLSKKATRKAGDTIRTENKELFDWLTEKEKQYNKPEDE